MQRKVDQVAESKAKARVEYIWCISVLCIFACTGDKSSERLRKDFSITIIITHLGPCSAPLLKV